MSSQLETELASLHSLEEELMDHQTFAQLLGNYGEFVGAIAVVATLADSGSWLPMTLRFPSRLESDVPGPGLR